MSLEKAIAHGKEKRKPYYDSRRFDPTCRARKGCPYCEGNRMHQTHRAATIADEEIKEYDEV